jgi:hypothetical protein
MNPTEAMKQLKSNYPKTKTEDILHHLLSCGDITPERLFRIAEEYDEQPKTYLFNWTCGGYNTVYAKNLQEAIKKCKSKEGLSHIFNDGKGSTLTVDLATIRIPKKGEIEALDRSWD